MSAAVFTGLITDLGTVERLTAGPVTDVWVSSSYSGDFALGESIACDGVCLTVVDFKGSSFKVQVAPETLRRSTAAKWAAGTRLNLERALRIGDRLGGHWVQGHVDGVGTIRELRADGGTTALRVSLTQELAPFFVEKGSVCIDGVSLTVTAVDTSSFSVMLIPETLARTSLGKKRVGDDVNLETDIIGRYVARMLGHRGGLTREQLERAGFV